MDFKELVKEYKEYHLDDPISCTSMGVHDKDHEVSDLSVKKIQKDFLQAKDLLKKLKSINKSSISFHDSIDYELMELDLQQAIFSVELEYNNLKDYEQKTQMGDIVIGAFMYLLLKDPRDSKLRLEATLSRMKKIPAMIEQYKEVIKQPIVRWKNIDIEDIKGSSELFEAIISWAQEENFEKLPELKAATKLVKESLDSYISFLESLPTGTNFVIGKEKARELARLVGIDKDLSTIHDTAKKFFREIAKEKTEIATKIKIKHNLDESLNLEGVLDFVKEKFSVPVNEVVDLYKKEQKNVLNFLKDHSYFVMPKSHELVILKTPKYLITGIPVGAMFSPASFEEGPKKSLIYLTIDEGRKSDQNSLMIKNTMIHEGIPGHHLQLSVAAENDSVVRKLASYNTHAEGWTTYMERFMTETGFIDKDLLDEYNLIGLSDLSRLAARVAIDLFFMTGDDSYLDLIEGFTPKGDDVFEKAQSLLQKATGFSDARCQGELNWYSQIRGYPMCYLMGNRMLYELRDDILKNADNKEEVVKEFHKVYLTEGVMTLPLLRKVCEHKGLL